jgi:hypothetical protein
MKITTSFLLIFYTVMLTAQTSVYELTPLPLNDLTSFKTPSKQWQIVGNIIATMNDQEFKSQAGTGILFNKMEKSAIYKPDQNLLTALEHGDMYIEMDLMVPKGSNSGIYLQGRYEVQIFDSWGVKHPHHSDLGGIYQRWIDATQTGYEGHAPRANASLAPGLWQHIAIEFQAPRFDAAGKKVKDAVMKKVALNGILLHENVLLKGSTRAAAFEDEKPTGPLMIQGDHGQVAFRNIKYALLGDYKPDIKSINYVYHEGNINNFEQMTAANLIRKGTTSVIDFHLADNANKMGLIFNATFDIDETADYQWIIKRNGLAKLSVDDKEIMKPTWVLREDNAVYTTRLERGTHTFTLGHTKDFNWRSTALGLFLLKPNKRPFAFHNTVSLPDPDPVPHIEVPVENYPKMVRHYAEHSGKKKTHVISVGNPQGVHFMYDLNQAGLMQVWKGDFLNTTEMWYERGEPQTAVPLGGGMTLAGRCPIAIISENYTSLPDTLDPYKELIFNGYTLDTLRRATFKFLHKDLSFTENLDNTEGGKGLKRVIKVTNPNNKKFIYRLADGVNIEDLGNGFYAIDNQKYYLQLNTLDKPRILVNKDKKELIIEKTDKESTVIYTIYF